jgi:hypothetical protein
MIDKAAIFTELTRRNAIRRQAQLPLLDMRDEFDRAVEYASWKVVCEEHGDRGGRSAQIWISRMGRFDLIIGVAANTRMDT